MIGGGDTKVEGRVKASKASPASVNRKPVPAARKVANVTKVGSSVTAGKPAAPKLQSKSMIGSTRWSSNPGTAVRKTLSADQQRKRVVALIKEGYAKLRKGDLDGAAQTFTDVGMVPGYDGPSKVGLVKVARVYAERGKRLYTSDKYTAAAEQFQLARMYDTKNATAIGHLKLIAQKCVARGIKLYRAKNFKGAQKEFELARRCEPTNRDAKRYLKDIGKKLDKRI